MDGWLAGRKRRDVTWGRMIVIIIIIIIMIIIIMALFGASVILHLAVVYHSHHRHIFMLTSFNH